jgi:hypothetical protein
VVAQVDEAQAAEVAGDVGPPAQGDGLADQGLVDETAEVGTHGGSGRNLWVRRTEGAARSGAGRKAGILAFVAGLLDGVGTNAAAMGSTSVVIGAARLRCDGMRHSCRPDDLR